ncbi:DNA-processing protein DprA [Polynucleobacter sp. AP-Latsch-80-C2]|uniref:DNA-processing protein DprA n=1 Tax=Polynucleobacter sp. AP-Latsch-80-C2 TaxID=2576931 RepID=UPI0021065252|nr:DNA-processing protein DprA [Polynucleobacter sp. AP-Latsch-80-C2]
MQNLCPRPILQIQRNDSCYPVRLNDLYDPPKQLFIHGDAHLLNMPMIAIVGSRAASSSGLCHAAFFAQALSKAGALVISGLAKGVDGAAHQAVLRLGQGHLTAAVCGTGLNLTYPREHVGLARAISRQGLLISELPLGAGPKPFHFPRRNRLIAALALGVVVIEAAEKSGSLITARLAAEMGREVFALPGAINNPLSGGCHKLIQQGAKLVCNPEEVLEELIFRKNPI